jgi:hypothetical protein
LSRADTGYELAGNIPAGGPEDLRKLRRQSIAPHLPAISTVHAVLDRHGLVKRRRRRRPGLTGTPLSRPSALNALWCAGYKANSCSAIGGIDVDRGTKRLGRRHYLLLSRSRVAKS